MHLKSLQGEKQEPNVKALAFTAQSTLLRQEAGYNYSVPQRDTLGRSVTGAVSKLAKTLDFW
jgi:hypothetical protein